MILKRILPIFVTGVMTSLVAFAQDGSNVFPSPGTDCLIARYEFDGNVNDTSGNAHHGSTVLAVFEEDRFNDTSHSAKLNGLTERVLIPYDTAFNLENNVTITAWVKSPVASDSIQGIFAFGTGLWGNAGYYLRLNEGKVNFAVSQPYTECLGATNLADNKWYHVAATYNDSVMKVYVDGNLDQTRNIGNALDKRLGSTTIELGHEGIGVQYFQGNLDDVRIYYCAKSDQDIKDIYNEQVMATKERSYEEVQAFELYPNPTTSIATLVGKEAIEFVEAYNSLGQIVKVFQLNGAAEGHLDFTELQNGTYIMRIVTKSGGVGQLLFVKK